MVNPTAGRSNPVTELHYPPKRRLVGLGSAWTLRKKEILLTQLRFVQPTA